jgi:antiviral helicase SKI2
MLGSGSTVAAADSDNADHCLHLTCTAGGGGGGGGSERAQLQDLIQLLRKRDLLPVAFFTFSKKRCDSAADACSGLDLTTSAEKHTVHVFVQQVLSRLREGDRELPQVRSGWWCLGDWGAQL